MDKFYKQIENKIREAGYEGELDGYEIYNEVSDFIDDKENGSYIFMKKKENDTIFEYQISVMPENFNLSYIKITTSKNTYLIDFDK
jgi:hypothetical protein